ncbi:MAG: HAD hydrolase family protein [Oscillospiraceae bacterium]|nr:HAD hydrolase family protein [Oscillospiraceae bacterium]
MNDDKEISPEDMRALYAMAEAGIEFVPASGRAFGGMPEEIVNLPFINWAVEVNGARVYDIKAGCVRHYAVIERDRAVELFDHLQSFGTYCDCFIDGQALAPGEYYDRIPEYACGEALQQVYFDTRRPVENLREQIVNSNKGVEKFQMLFKSDAERQVAAADIAKSFPDITITSAIDFNLELNSVDASKGLALMWLCRELCVSPKQVMAIGDGRNDISMLKAAGFSVAVENAEDEVKKAADHITGDNNSSGFARAIDLILD